MNKVILMGRLTRDAETRTGKNQDGSDTSYTNGTLAVDRLPGNNEAGADFINFSVKGKMGENLVRFVKKGDQVLLEGSWRTGSYQNKDGVTVYTNTLMVSKVEFVGNKKATENGNPAQGQPTQGQPTQGQQSQTASSDEFYEMDDEELPFN